MAAEVLNRRWGAPHLDHNQSLEKRERQMRLGINGWRIHGQRTGIGRYLLKVLRHWTPSVVQDRFTEINLYTQKPLDSADLRLPENIQERVIGPELRMLMWENLRFAPRATDDVLFCPSYSRPLLTKSNTVVAMFDATLHLHPELYPVTARIFNDRLYGWSARHSTLVITGSETAREDIVRSYGVPYSKIRVVPLAPADIFKPLPGDPAVGATVANYLGSPVPYFLFVGKITARRNVPKLMEAFGELKRRKSLPHKLLVIGLNTAKLNLVSIAEKSGIAADFKHCDYVTDHDLNYLYNGAEAFVMPYTYEAVSLTALEAQATGLPVITVDTPGLREITDGIALRMPGANRKDILDALAKMAADSGLRRELSEKGLAHAMRFSWERCAAETIRVLYDAARLPFDRTSFNRATG
jgi:glycosyltransferase involved in cell wall biosynthesis